MSNEQQKPIILKIGGSVVIPDSINAEFLNKFKEMLMPHIENGRRFIMIIGGGGIARKYQTEIKEIGVDNTTALDWVGIRLTHVNAAIVQAFFGKLAYRELVIDPEEDAKGWDTPILFAGGYRPGYSTDYIATLLAERFDAEQILVTTNVGYIYTDDFNKNPDARPLPHLTWDEYLDIIPNEWTPGLSTPIDPIAAKYARDHKQKIVVINGENIENMDKCLRGEEFEGSTLEQ